MKKSLLCLLFISANAFAGAPKWQAFVFQKSVNSDNTLMVDVTLTNNVDTKFNKRYLLSGNGDLQAQLVSKVVADTQSGDSVKSADDLIVIGELSLPDPVITPPPDPDLVAFLAARTVYLHTKAAVTLGIYSDGGSEIKSAMDDMIKKFKPEYLIYLF